MKKVLTKIVALLLMAFLVGACKDSDRENAPTELMEFSVVDQNGTNHVLSINHQKSIISNRETLPPYVNVGRLIAQFKLSRTDAVLKINDVQQRSGRGQTDFTSDVVYDLYVGNTKERSYTVTINKVSLANTFQSFGFTDEGMAQFPVTIDEETGEITNETVIPKNVDITALQPKFTLNETRGTVKVNGVKQVSEVQRHNFSRPVVYTIEGEDGTSRTYTVNLNQGDFIAIENPVISGSYADPTVIHVGNEFYTYVTGGIVRGYRSSDLFNWRSIGPPSEVFTSRPDFVEVVSGKDAPGMWAPDINYFDGRYVMYYSISQWGEGGKAGIGVAVSNHPQGPFVPPARNENGKLFVGTEIGVHNSIDPCFFEEKGKKYLFWGSFYSIYMTELTDDGMAVKDMGQKTQVAGGAFEGTYIHKRGNYYYLFASVGGCCDGLSSSYKVVVGRSENLAGPYLNRAGVDLNSIDGWGAPGFDPIVLQGNERFVGPGHNARIITDKNDVDWMLYHAYENVNGSVGSRNLMLGKVNWDSDGWPKVDDGTPSAMLTEMPAF